MKYIFLAYRDEEGWQALAPGERRALQDDCQAREAQLLSDGRLEGALDAGDGGAAITARLQAGRVVYAEGPCPARPGELVRLFLIEATDLNEAMRLAGQLPQLRMGPIEVRPATG